MLKLCIVCLLIFCVSIVCSGCRTDGLVPDDGVRKVALSINASNISSLQFSGNMFSEPTLSSSPYSLSVSDPTIIAAFLDGLRDAFTRGPARLIANQTNRIVFVEKDGHMSVFAFAGADSYGPKFRAAFDMLSRYETDQVHQRVAREATQIKAVDFYGPKVTQKSEIGKIVQALEKLNEKAFAHSNAQMEACGLILVLNNGQKDEILLRTAHPADLYHQPLPDLPPPLNAYLQPNSPLIYKLTAH